MSLRPGPRIHHWKGWPTTKPRNMRFVGAGNSPLSSQGHGMLPHAGRQSWALAEQRRTHGGGAAAAQEHFGPRCGAAFPRNTTRVRLGKPGAAFRDHLGGRLAARAHRLVSYLPGYIGHRRQSN